MEQALTQCSLCPRNCKVDRYQRKGVCQAGAEVELALVSLHQWEEPCLSATKGAGTVFFSHCSMRCIFCQNHEISTEGKGFVVSIERLAEIFTEQQQRGAHCLELVTPTHYVPQIIEALKLAKAWGLDIPVVYNSSGYENIDTLKLLSDYVDIFLPDFKYFSSETSWEYSRAKDYVEVAKCAIQQMVDMTGPPVLDKHGIMRKGVIVRHLVLPWHYKESMQLLEYLWQTYHQQIYLSLMNQYTPMYKAQEHPKLKRKLTTFEYDKVVNHALDLGFTQCFIQQGATATTKFVPNFDGSNIYK